MFLGSRPATARARATLTVLFALCASCRDVSHGSHPDAGGPGHAESKATEASRQAAASDRGHALFAAQCAVCHAGGGVGPNLGGVVGRTAGRARGFGYSRALRSLGTKWDRPRLDEFLKSPTALAPGTTMVVSVTDPSARADLIAYLATLPPDEGARAPGPVASVMPSAARPGLRTGRSSMLDYRDDGPGVRRRITLADLPAPFETPSSRNAVLLADAPTGAALHVPSGFSVARFVTGLTGPRLVRVAPNGDIFVVESSVGRLRVLRAPDGVATPEKNEVFAEGLDRPFGVAFYPLGPSPKWLYVANTNSVVRFAYHPGDLHAVGAAETVVPALTAAPGGGHWTRDLRFSPDGTTLYVSVGSGSNVAESMPRLSSSGVTQWEKTHGMGASWDAEEGRADVLAFDPAGGHRRTYATGIRNCVGLAVSPSTGDLWCSTNERDGLGDNLVPDYITRVREGAFYGWPWYFVGDHEDPRHKGERPDLAGKVTVPDVLLAPHSASLEMTFYDGQSFPNDMHGDIFAALHGSWNRSTRTGYKVIRVHLRDGIPTGEYEDFLTGFVIDDDHVWGRPVGVAVAHDGALLVSEDGDGSLWRVSYTAR